MARKKEFEPDEVLERAMEIFWKKGYEATSMQDLVEHMGISRGSMYETFGGKKELFSAALDRYAGLAFENGIQNLKLSATPLDAIEQLLLHTVDTQLNPTGGCMLTNTACELAPRDPQVLQNVSSTLSRFENALHGALKKAQKQGELAQDKNPRALARHIVATVQGLAVVGRTRPKRAAMIDVVESLMSLLRTPTA